MTLRKLFHTNLLLVLLALVGCSQMSSEAPALADHEASAVMALEAAPPDRGRVNLFASNSPAAAAGSLMTLAAMGQIQPDRYLIKNATVTIEVDNPEDSATAVTTAASDAGGYIGALNESTDGLGRRTVTMTVRIPSDRFDDLMVNLSLMGKILQKNITTQDVTEEFVDTEARSRNLKVSEQRIIEHLGRAGTLEDILRVETELTRVRQQIEQLDGRLRFLSHRVAYSTLNLTLQETPAMESVLPAETFSIGKTFSEATRSLTGLGQRALVIAIWLGVWSPVWIAAIFVAFTARRRIRGRATA